MCIAEEKMESSVRSLRSRQASETEFANSIYSSRFLNVSISKYKQYSFIYSWDSVDMLD